VKHPDGGNFVVFGSGKFIETSDAAGPFTTQSLYGVRDLGSGSVLRTDLVQQSILSTVSGTQIDPGTGMVIDSGIVFRSGTNNTVDYAGGDMGWYMDLPVASGESMPFNPLTTGGLALFSTVAPSSNPCEFGGESFVMALDVYTGTASGYGSFDADNDGSFSATESVTSGGVAQSTSIIGVRSSVGITPTPNVIGGAGAGASGFSSVPEVARFSAYGAASNSTGTSLLDLNGTGGFAQVPLSEALKATGRVLWKEIVQ
jgi:type IV pilus assembly protein PilY1